MLADESVIEDVNGDMENEKYHITYHDTVTANINTGVFKLRSTTSGPADRLSSSAWTSAATRGLLVELPAKELELTRV